MWSTLKTSTTAVALAALLPHLSWAQQFAGAPVSNQSALGNVPGSQITWFNILDPNNKNATLTNYLSLNSANAIMDPTAMKRLVIVIHGNNRDPGTYMSNMLVALSNVDSSVVQATVDNTQILAPYFPNVSNTY